MPHSSLESAFDQYLSVIGSDLPPHETEYVFAKPRRWRFDYCFIPQKVAIELDGGSWSGGRHTRGKGFEADCEKLNAATLLGFKTLRFTSTMLKNDPVGCVEQVRRLLAYA
jgi:very-short-patch-repair endonuclease